MSFPGFPTSGRAATRRGCLAIGIAVALSGNPAAASASVLGDGLQFSEGFLLGAPEIERALRGAEGTLPPGVHTLEIVINGEIHGSHDLVFQPPASGEDAAHGTLCLPRELVPVMGLKPSLQEALHAVPGDCIDLPGSVPGARVELDVAALRLLVSVPQAAQEIGTRGEVPRAERDAGITAAFLDYTVNHSRFQNGRSDFLGLNAGVNLGPWRVRHRGALSRSAVGRHYSRVGTTLQRDLPAWNSQLLIGEANTSGELFPSVGYEGIRVSTDDRMLPDSLRGYAPRVQGVADSNAVVTIRQNGNIIHQENVAPGPFLIEDLYATNQGGDLEVTITEADGRERRSRVAFSAVPQALRAGASRFSTTTGTLRAIEGSQRPLRFTEATYVRGVNDFLTLIGGAQIAEGYRAGLAGAAINTPVGAFGADLTRASTSLRQGQQAAGNSFRLNYQRHMAASGTHVGLAAYRYSTRSFFTLAEAAHPARDGWSHDAQARQRYELNLSQRLPGDSTLSLIMGHVAYWNVQRRRNDLQLAFQGRWRTASYGLSAMRFHQHDGTTDTRYGLNVSVPLGRSAGAPRMHSQIAQSHHGQQAQLGINGALGDRRDLNYSVSASRAAAGHTGYSGYMAYQGAQFNATGGYSRSEGAGSSTLGLAGSVVLHGQGLTFGQPMGESAVLVQALGATGAALGGSNIRIGRNGHALFPHVSAYRWNRVELDPSALPMEVELLQTSHRVAPTAGSIVRVVFPVRRDRVLFIDATDEAGHPLPFAAPVSDESGAPAGAVGQGSIIQLRGALGEGVLEINMGGGKRCRLPYRMPEKPDASGLSWSQGVCVSLPSPGLRAGREGQDSGSALAASGSRATP